jgi:TP901 family phage tail tape measure protein
MSEEKIGALIAQLGLDIKDFKASMEEVKTSFKKVETEAEKSSQSISRSLDKTAGSMQKFGKNLSMYVTAPILGLGAAAFNAEKKFDHQMNMMVSMVGIAKDEVEAMRVPVMNLASETGIMAQELADAMQYITSSGFEDTAEALDILSASAKVAAVNQVEVKNVSDLVTSAMNAYRKSGLEASDVTDMLVRSVALGKAEFEDLVAAMGIILPVASDMGVSFEEISGMMAMLTRTGTTAETAATQLRQLLSQLMGPASQAHEALESLNWSADAFRKTVAEKGLFQALIQFKDKLYDLGNVEIADDVFGNIRALSAFLNVTGEAMEENIHIAEEMKNSIGETDRAFKEYSNTITAVWNRALSDSNNALIEFGSSLKEFILPMLITFSNSIKNLAAWWRGLSDSQKNFIQVTAVVAASLGPIIILVAKMIKLYGAVRLAIIGIANAYKAARKAASLYNAVQMANPYGLAIAAVGLLVGGLVNYIGKLKEARKETELLADATNEFNAAKFLQQHGVEPPPFFDIPSFPDPLLAADSKNLSGIASVKQFEALEVAAKKAQGPLVALREGLSKWSYKEIGAVVSYYTNELEEAQEQLARLQSMNKKGPEHDTLIANMIKQVDFLQQALDMSTAEYEALGRAIDKLKKKTEFPDNSFKRLKNEISKVFTNIEGLGEIDALHNLGLQIDVTQEKIKYLRDTLVNLVQDKNIPVNDQQIVYLIDLITQLQQELETLQQDQGIYQSLFDEMDRAFGQFDLMGKFLPGFDALGAKADWLKQKMKDLIQQGFQEGSRELEMLKWQFEEITADIQQAGQAIANSIISIASKSLNNFESFDATNQYKALIAYINELKQALDKLDPSIEANKVAISELENEIEKAEKAMQGFVDIGKELSQSFGNLLGDIIQTLFSDLEDGTTIFEKLGLVIADFLQSLGRALIATGMAKIAFDAVASNPYAAIAAGAALVALGAMVRNTFAKGLGGGGQEQSTANYAVIPAFAEGGIVSGPTLGLMGEYPGAKSNPEVIAPLDKLKAMINPNPAFFGQVEFEIKGDRLVGVLDTYNRRVKSYRP